MLRCNTSPTAEFPAHIIDKFIGEIGPASDNLAQIGRELIQKRLPPRNFAYKPVVHITKFAEIKIHKIVIRIVRSETSQACIFPATIIFQAELFQFRNEQIIR